MYRKDYQLIEPQEEISKASIMSFGLEPKF